MLGFDCQFEKGPARGKPEPEEDSAFHDVS